MKRVINIAFVDFWTGFDYSIMTFYHILCKHFEVIIHADINVADYVFFSCFGDKHWNVPPEKIKIFITAENISPDFNTCDYAVGFDRLSFGDRYMRFPNIYGPITKKGVLGMVSRKHLSPFPKKDSFCSFVVSNAEAESVRVRLFELLSKYKKVDSGGRYLNNVGGPVPDKLSFDRQHKFSICCENSAHAGYITEKIYEAFSAQLIPIYWGAPDIGLTFNKYSFINVADFASLEDAVDYIKAVDNDENLYRKILSEPALINADDESWDSYYDKLESFLLNIFNQPLGDAFRYHRTRSNYYYPNRIAELLQLKDLMIIKFFRRMKHMF